MRNKGRPSMTSGATDEPPNFPSLLADPLVPAIAHCCNVYRMKIHRSANVRCGITHCPLRRIAAGPSLFVYANGYGCINVFMRSKMGVFASHSGDYLTANASGSKR